MDEEALRDNDHQEQSTRPSNFKNILWTSISYVTILW